jgi:hypothetical protein
MVIHIANATRTIGGMLRSFPSEGSSRTIPMLRRKTIMKLKRYPALMVGA